MKRSHSLDGASTQKRRVSPVPVTTSLQQEQPQQPPPQSQQSQQSQQLQQQQRQQQQQQPRRRRRDHQLRSRPPSAGVLKMRADAKKLPISMAKERLLAAIQRQPVTIVVGETGSGKTTQLPQFLLEAGYAARGKMIGVTQPRRVAAISVAGRVAKEQGQALGKTVGYTIRFDDKSSRSTRIKYLTDGMLLREALTDRHLEQYSVIVLDEAHERTVSTDVLFALVKRELTLQQRQRQQQDVQKELVERGPLDQLQLRVVVMSATLEADKYSKYFDGAGIEYVEGRQFPVSLMYTPAPESDFIDGTLITTIQVHLTQPLDGDILVFLPGQEDIEALQRLIEQKLKDLPPDVPSLLVRVLYAALPQDQQMRAFDETPPGCRKVVIATNIAETSLTLSGLRYVIDCGLVKQRTHSTTGMDVLQTAPISQAQARQRSGRAGREAPGSCYRVYTEADYCELAPTTTPEIIRADLATVMLQLLSMGVDNPLEFDFLDTPRKESTVQAMEHLHALGAVDTRFALTTKGRKMADFPLAPIYASMLLRSAEFGCTEEAITVVALLSADNIWYNPSSQSQRAEAEARHRLLSDPHGDHLSLLAVWRAYTAYRSGELQLQSGSGRSGSIEDWCRENFINARSMKKAGEVRKQLQTLCNRHEVAIASCGDDLDCLRKCLAAGLFLHVALRGDTGQYATLAEHHIVYIHPTSVLKHSAKKPSHLVFSELVLTSRQYLRFVTAIEPEWLLEFAPHYVRKHQNAGMAQRKDQNDGFRRSTASSAAVDRSGW